MQSVQSPTVTPSPGYKETVDKNKRSQQLPDGLETGHTLMMETEETQRTMMYLISTYSG